MMKRQEDIIKEKLEAFEEVLPEGSLADFRKRYDASRAASARKSKRTVWYSVAAALAACLAGVIALTMPQDNPVAQEENRVVELVRNDETVEPDESDVLAAGAQAVRGVAAVTPAAASSVVHSSKQQESVIEEQSRQAENGDETATEEKKDESRDDGSSSAFASDHTYTQRRADINIVPAAVAGGVVLGGTLLGGVLASVRNSGGFLYTSIDSGCYEGGVVDPGNRKDEITGAGKHSLPLKIGTSIRWMMTERLSLTSALEYSLYTSEFNRSLSGKHRQQAHYLGIPLRLDYSFVRSRWLDVYAGAGGTADYCLAAKDNGVSIGKDGVSFSLQAVAGAQLNFTGNIGAFIEPQVSWAIPSRSRVLETYRTEHPVSFNIAAGIRVTFGK